MNENGFGQSKIKEIIRGLLAKANNVYSHEGTAGITEALQNEAAAAAAKAAELMQKYNLKMEEFATPEEIAMTEVVSLYTMAKLDKWRVTLASAIASHFFCKTFFAKGVHANPFFAAKGKEKLGIRWEVWFYGRKANAEMAAFVWDQLHGRLMEMVEVVVSEYASDLEDRYGVQAFKVGHGSAHPNVYRNSWLFGAVLGIYEKLQEQRRHAANDVKAIIILRDEEVEKAWVDRSAGFNTHLNSNPSSLREDAYLRGKQAGREMEIHSGIE